METAWQSAEVAALYRLAAANVRVPVPYGVTDGVLLMELVTDAHGDRAPRLSEVELTPSQALEDHALMMRYVVRMLCAGLIHGDLSEFNVLVDAEGPVIIDLPQAADAAANNSARAMLLRDVNNMRDYYGRYVPQLLESRFAEEIWALYESGELDPETPLTGDFEDPTHAADVDGVLLEIQASIDEEEERRQRVSDAESLD